MGIPTDTKVQVLKKSWCSVSENLRLECALLRGPVWEGDEFSPIFQDMEPRNSPSSGQISHGRYRKETQEIKYQFLNTES